MKVAYIDAAMGLSGGMVMGALLQLGASAEALEAELAKLPFTKCDIRQAVYRVDEICALRVTADVEAARGELTIHTVSQAVQESDLSPPVKAPVLRTLTVLAEAVNQVYGATSGGGQPRELHLPRALAEIVAVPWALRELGIERVYVATLPLGMSQGGPSRRVLLSPLVVELLRGFLVRVGGDDIAAVTPVAAAILKALARQGKVPQFRLTGVGYGVGEPFLTGRPQVLPILVGEMEGEVQAEELLVLETNIDDLNPEFYEYVMERLFAAGARDVFLLPIQMKKNRPGVLLWVLGDVADREKLTALIFSETSTLGIRSYPVTRVALRRAHQEVSTPYGLVRVKLAYGPGGQVHLAPEYEDCKRLARERQVPLKVIYDAALYGARTT